MPNHRLRSSKLNPASRFLAASCPKQFSPHDSLVSGCTLAIRAVYHQHVQTTITLQRSDETSFAKTAAENTM